MQHVKWFPISSFTLLCVSVSAGANTTTFRLNNANIGLSVPSHWQAVRDFFGMPLMLLGPSVRKGRPTVSIAPTGMKNLRFLPTELKANQDSYRAGREDWLQRRNGKSLEYFPYQFQIRSDGSEIHQIGFRYVLSGVAYSEHSYFILCGGNLYHAKTLLRVDQEKESDSTVRELVESFTCK
jgi:hypothetical protein